MRQSPGKTLAAVIEDALREMLVSSQSRSERADRVRLKTSGTGGVQPGVNLDSRAMLLDAIEGGY